MWYHLISIHWGIPVIKSCLGYILDQIIKNPNIIEVCMWVSGAIMHLTHIIHDTMTYLNYAWYHLNAVLCKKIDTKTLCDKSIKACVWSDAGDKRLGRPVDLKCIASKLIQSVRFWSHTPNKGGTKLNFKKVHSSLHPTISINIFKILLTIIAQYGLPSVWIAIIYLG